MQFKFKFKIHLLLKVRKKNFTRGVFVINLANWFVVFRPASRKAQFNFTYFYLP